MDYVTDPFETITNLNGIEKHLTGWDFPISEEICHNIESKDNYGFKFDAISGANVKAAKDGIVFLVAKNDQNKWSTENGIILYHGEGIYTGYKNLSKQYFNELDIKKGKEVKQNQVIGVLGLPSYLLFKSFVYIKNKENPIMKQEIIPIKFNREELMNKNLTYKEMLNCPIA